jgi:small-conductance mechanosensitive channel
MTAVLILVIGLWLSGRLARGAERFVVRRFDVEPNLARITRRWVLAFTFIVLVVFSLVSVKIPLTVFAFLGGAVAIGVGFGMQNLLKNLMSGLMLLSERPFRPGDIVEVGGVRGTVTDINVRSSTIRDGNGIETLVPNSTFIEQNVTNWTYTSRRVRQTIKVGVAYGSPTREVSDLLLQAVDRHGLVLKEPKPQVQFEDFGADALMFGLYYWLELKPGVESPTVASDLRFMIEKTLTENGVGIAFPQRDVHLDAARPLPVQIVAASGPQGEPATK